MKNTMKIFGLVFLALVFMVQGGYYSDFVEQIPFGGPILSALLKVFYDGAGNIPAAPVNWSINEVLNTVLIATMSAVLGNVVGISYFHYDNNVFKQRVQYFLCDIIAVIFSCFIADGICDAFESAFPTSSWTTQIILIILFSIIDIGIFCKNRDGSINILSIRVFFSEIITNVIQFFLVIIVILSIYVIILNPTTASGLICVIIVGLGISYMVSRV